MGGDNVHAAEDVPTNEHTCIYDSIDVDTGLRTGDCMCDIDEDDFCMPCSDHWCNSSDALAASQPDSNHCINGCPHETDGTHAIMAASPETVDEDMLARYMARYPHLVTPAMTAAVKATNDRYCARTLAP